MQFIVTANEQTEFILTVSEQQFIFSTNKMGRSQIKRENETRKGKEA